MKRKGTLRSADNNQGICDMCRYGVLDNDRGWRYRDGSSDNETIKMLKVMMLLRWHHFSFIRKEKGHQNICRNLEIICRTDL